MFWLNIASTLTLGPFFFHVSTAVIGLLYPCMDRHLGEPHKFKREWSSVMRCVAVFVGINHASAVSYILMKSAVTNRFPVKQSLHSHGELLLKYNVQHVCKGNAEYVLLLNCDSIIEGGKSRIFWF